MDLSFLIVHSLAHGAYLTVALAGVMALSYITAPDVWVGDYPPDIRDRYGEMSARAKRLRPLYAALFFGSVIITLILSISRLRSVSLGDAGFLDYALSTFLILMVFNAFDLLIADWLIFVLIQPKRIVLPGTEGMMGYKDYGFHFRGFLVGIVFSALAGLFSGLAAVGFDWLGIR